jgi:hypothetical protein
MSLLKVTNITDTSGLGSAYAKGHVVQVVSATKTDTFTMSSSTFADVTGLSVSITPKSATSKILITLNISGGGTPGLAALVGRLMRDSTPIAIGDAEGSRIRATIGNTVASDSSHNPSASITYLDSPATTSPITYKLQVANNGANSVWINRSSADTNSASFTRAVSSITLMEIAQ